MYSIERYTPAPLVLEFLVVDDSTTFENIRQWCWIFVPVAAVPGLGITVNDVVVVAGMRISREGNMFVAPLDGMQLIPGTSALYQLETTAP